MINNKKILVAYYSKTGNTERVAKDIALRLGADLEKIIDKKNRKGLLGYIFGGRDATKKRLTKIEDIQKDPQNYDLIILGTPVWGWNATPAACTYLDKIRGRIKNAAYFITSGNTEPEKIVPYLEELAQKKAIASVGFASQELKDNKTYEEKLKAFLEIISRQNF